MSGQDTDLNEMFTERHYQIQFIGILEGELERYDERIVYEGQDGPFCQNMRDFSRSTSNMCFPDRL